MRRRSTYTGTLSEKLSFIPLIIFIGLALFVAASKNPAMAGSVKVPAKRTRELSLTLAVEYLRDPWYSGAGSPVELAEVFANYIETGATPPKEIQ